MKNAHAGRESPGKSISRIRWGSVALQWRIVETFRRKGLPFLLLLGGLGSLISPVMAIIPVNGPITSPFGWRADPLNGQTRFHAGIDIAAESGTPVLAAQAGYVVFSGEYGGYGEVVVLAHGNTLYTLYGHNSQRLVEAGQYVAAGQIIARVGATGRVTGPHLHFEVHYNQQYLPPLVYLNVDPMQVQMSPHPPQMPMPMTIETTNGPPPVPTHAARTAPARTLSAQPVLSSGDGVTAAPQPRRENRRLSAPRAEYGKNAIQMVKGNQIETIRF